MTNDFKAEKAPINWPVTLVLGLTFVAAITIVPWYGIVYGFSDWAWIFFTVFLGVVVRVVLSGRRPRALADLTALPLADDDRPHNRREVESR